MIRLDARPLSGSFFADNLPATSIPWIAGGHFSWCARFVGGMRVVAQLSPSSLVNARKQAQSDRCGQRAAEGTTIQFGGNTMKLTRRLALAAASLFLLSAAPAM